MRNCEKLCNYLEILIDSIAEFSFKVNNKSGRLEYLNANQLTHPFLGDLRHFRENFSLKIKEFLKTSTSQNQTNTTSDKTKAYVYPLLQINDAGVDMDQRVTRKLFENLPGKISLAVGYFNLTSDYIESMVKRSSASYDLLVSSPEANGFFNSRGFSKHIPNIYSHLEEEFFKYYSRNNQQERIKMFEYNRENWSKYEFV
jgi:CDP-diacylglycerol--glycerol-3-phosphate 3-phosphatidyltransferase